MRKHRSEERLDVVRHDVLAALEERPAANAALEGEQAADGRAELDELELPRRTDDGHDPALDQRVDVDVLDGTLKRAHLGDRDDRCDVVERMAATLVGDDLALVLLLRIPERRLEQE